MADLMCPTGRSRWTTGVLQALVRVGRRGDFCAFCFLVVAGFAVTLCAKEKVKGQNSDTARRTRVGRKREAHRLQGSELWAHTGWRPAPVCSTIWEEEKTVKPKKKKGDFFF